MCIRDRYNNLKDIELWQFYLIGMNFRNQKTNSGKKRYFCLLYTSRPILLPRQFKFWEWLSDYYLCTQGDVYKAALPSGLTLESETIVEYLSLIHILTIESE